MITRIDRLIEQVGESNAQLFRELKGRLKLRNLLLAGGLSFAGQLLLVASFSDQKCRYSDSAVSRCVAPYWEIDWLQIFQSLYWILSLILFAGGVYLLVSDLTQEQRRGTLNFIRLSPQSSQKIFVGKLLGVPVLVYLAILLAVPLHLISAIAAGVPIGWVISLYALLLVGASCFFTAAMLNAMFTTVQYQDIAWSFVSVWFGSSYIGLIFSGFSWNRLTYNSWADWKWFFLPIGNSLALSTLWLFITIGLVNYWIWQALNRRFNNPDGTLINKKQSYWLVGSCQVWLLGLYWPLMQPVFSDDSLLLSLFTVAILTLFLLLLIGTLISPHRQSLIDWSRDRNQSQIKQQTLFGMPRLWQDLIFGEKSPALVAIAINLGITTLIWVPFWLFAPSNILTKMQAIAAWVISVNLIFIYALIIQLGILMKSKKRGIFAGSQVSSVLLFPILILAVSETKTPFLWMFSVFGSAWVFMPEASVIAIAFTILGQWLLIAGLNSGLTGKLNQLGASDSKKLLNPG
jgi:hypothetical protein